MAERVLEIHLRDHPGAMSHVTSLFARRAFNLAGILCAPPESRGVSRVLLLVEERERLAQVVKQLEKLQDVQAVRYREDVDRDAFQRAVP